MTIVSEGTLRPQDLVESFTDEYEQRGGCPDHVRDYRRILERWTVGPQDESFEGLIRDEDLGYALENLFEDLNEVAPDNCSFGAHEGDGALFGFFKIIEEN